MEKDKSYKYSALIYLPTALQRPFLLDFSKNITENAIE